MSAPATTRLTDPSCRRGSVLGQTQYGFALDTVQAQYVLSLLTQSRITYLVIGKSDEPPDNYDAVLDLAADGSWTWRTLTK